MTEVGKILVRGQLVTCAGRINRPGTHGMAFPGLKPQATPNPYLPSSSGGDEAAASSSVPSSPNSQ